MVMTESNENSDGAKSPPNIIDAIYTEPMTFSTNPMYAVTAHFLLTSNNKSQKISITK